MEIDNAGPGGAPARKNFSRTLAVAVGATCLALLVRAGIQKSQPRPDVDVPVRRDVDVRTPSAIPQGPTVGLTIDFGNHIRREYDALAWSADMTVGAALDAAAAAHPGLAFRQQGEGAMTFLVEFDGVANQGGGGRNWLYSVDGRHAKVSFRVCPLKPGQRVLWAFRQEE